MTEEWRLLTTDPMDAASNMALDEAVLRQSAERETGTVRFFSWRPKAISIGYFQGIGQEADLEKCRLHGVDVVRRITGGGAVFHDEELTYSVIVGQGHPKISDNIVESYGFLCEGVVLGLEKLGIQSEFKPINDIITGGKKISGNAQTRRYGGVLQHGTILCDVDVKMMFELLLVPDEKIKDKMIAAVEDRVTSISHQLGGVPEPDVIRKAMAEGFAEGLDVELRPGELTGEERRLMGEIRREKYGTDKWNYKR